MAWFCVPDIKLCKVQDSATARKPVVSKLGIQAAYLHAKFKIYDPDPWEDLASRDPYLAPDATVGWLLGSLKGDLLCRF